MHLSRREKGTLVFGVFGRGALGRSRCAAPQSPAGGAAHFHQRRAKHRLRVSGGLPADAGASFALPPFPFPRRPLRHAGGRVCLGRFERAVLLAGAGPRL